MQALILFGMVASFIATTIAEMKVAAPLRKIPIVGALFACAWCLSFWLALVVVLVFHPTAGLATGAPGIVLDWFLLSFIAGMASLLAKVFIKLGAA